MSLNCGKGACQVFLQQGEGSRSLPFTESHCKGLHSSNITSIGTWPSRPGVAGNRLQNKKGFINHANQNKSPHCFPLGMLTTRYLPTAAVSSPPLYAHQSAKALLCPSYSEPIRRRGWGPFAEALPHISPFKTIYYIFKTIYFRSC